ncbi:5-oxoprolinase subunit PxpB [Breoghania sp.]|uniref:5-oxoprolinase subunit PxpB n=1 Tax=Breoghania sp. TaxID=2065378 RepID=UPI002AA7F840|nr:5-oxoprolinase subunit PxpB [Breoghania sp.]
MSVFEHRITHIGERALLLDVAGPMNVDVQKRIWAMARHLAGHHEVVETVPGVHSVLVVLAPEVVPEAFRELLDAMWRRVEPLDTVGRLIEVPVSYGGEMGEDLADLAATHGLSVDEVVKRHTCPEYTVFALGSQPGLGYLGGLDPSLATPRRAVPRLSVVEGSIIIGGAQAGILSCTSPCGWHIIGHTALKVFDAHGEPPALLAPGDRIRFRAVEVLP